MVISMPLVLESSPFSNSMQMGLGYCAAMDILDHVASSVDIYHADHEMDNVHRSNMSSRTDQNCKSSHMDHANKFSRIPLAHLSMFSRIHLTLIDRLIHCHFCHHQRSSTMNQRQSINS